MFSQAIQILIDNGMKLPERRILEHQRLPDISPLPTCPAFS
jgi:hypothetical protein